jgi:two-component sensor histidine kinase
VTDLRSRDRELVTKDATIREIHHRVKNNLQTVAALLRLQARRIDSARGREGLEEAVRRVAAIAVVHETLSQTYEEEVEFDAVADQLLALVSEVGDRGGAHAGAVRLRRSGSFGTIGSEVATPLAMVLTEVLQNAMEHGFPDGRTGTVEVAARNSDDGLKVRVVDDGVGLPDGFDPAATSSLGLAIVRTLVNELGGTLHIGSRDEPGCAGTVVELSLP